MIIMNYDIADEKLSEKGVKRIKWAGENMPVLLSILNDFEKSKPLKDLRISACLHVTTETANLAIALKRAGAEVALCASNPLSTQDDVSAALVVEYDIPVFAVRGEDDDTYYSHINSVLDIKPHITMDDGADLVSVIHKERNDLCDDIIGGTEETTTGVIRLRSLEMEGKLLYPIVAINDALTKHMFDNRYGTGQSTIDGILRTTNRLIAGSTFVIAGYGWCGKGLAKRARGMGARVVVTEIDPLMALEAVMDGFRVMPMIEAARIGDIFVTVTGNISVISGNVFEEMKDGAIVANSGHFDVEIDKKSLKEMSTDVTEIRDNLVEYKIKDGRRIYLLGEGRLINLSGAEGHPSMVMDLSFSNQILTADYLKKNADKLEKKVYKVPDDIDERVAHLKLKSLGVEIDILTKEQEKYLASWELGT